MRYSGPIRSRNWGTFPLHFGGGMATFPPPVHTSPEVHPLASYTACPTRYRTRHFFNNFTTNENIATKFESDLPHCVRNVTTS